MLNKFILDILVCPETKQKVGLANLSLLNSLNEQIQKGILKNKKGEILTKQLEGGLVRDDHKVIYPIIDQIPMMLVDERIEL